MKDYSDLSKEQFEKKINYYINEIRHYLRKKYSNDVNEDLEKFIESNIEKLLLQFSDRSIVDNYLNQSISIEFKNIIEYAHNINELKRAMSYLPKESKSCEETILEWLKKNKITPRKLYDMQIKGLAKTIEKDLNQFTYNTIRVTLGQIKAKIKEFKYHKE